MQDQREFGSFEQVVLPHLDAAYNLARWLTRRPHDAEDVVQDACLRAFNAFARFQGGDARCWLLTIVRNTCYTWLERNRQHVATATLDDTVHNLAACTCDPQAIIERQDTRDRLKQKIEALPPEFREVLILREFEGLSYQQIASIAQVPVGTVMSRLSRARQRLADSMRRTQALEEA